MVSEIQAERDEGKEEGSRGGREKLNPEIGIYNCFEFRILGDRQVLAANLSFFA